MIGYGILKPQLSTAYLVNEAFLIDDKPVGWMIEGKIAVNLDGEFTMSYIFLNKDGKIKRYNLSEKQDFPHFYLKREEALDALLRSIDRLNIKMIRKAYSQCAELEDKAIYEFGEER